MFGTPQRLTADTVSFYEEVLHFKNLSLDGIVGQTPISVIRDNIGSNRAATKFNAKFYKNGGAPFGVVKAPTLLDRKVNKFLEKTGSG
ncbi:phage portal protein [Bacillus licheniformis]|nr:phage portal protein [Bacillus licheniformis]